VLVPSDLAISTATLEQAQKLGAWAEREGWSPGTGDIEAFYAADPEGFLVGHIQDRMVAAASAVRYDRDFAFCGFYIVEPDLRQQGLGHVIADAALQRVGSLVAGLDGVAAQVANYETLGFVFAHWTSRFSGRVSDVVSKISMPAGIQVVDVDAESSLFAEVIAYDTAHVPAPRAKFVSQWLQPNSPRRSFAALRDGAFAGYATVRPTTSEGARIGPLFADDEEVARALLIRCAQQARAWGGTIAIDVPDRNSAAVALAKECGMVAAFTCARMYRGAEPVLPPNEIWGSTTFELG
jgi:GNAT superfamily N-acetyltransferase